MAKLPILMYHKVSAEESKGLTIASERLEAQFQYLSERNYRSYHLSELTKLRKLPQKKNILITFDDGYVNQLEFAVPLLRKYNLKATFFIPLNYMGKEDSWNQITAAIMDREALQSLDPSIIELAYHSFAHQKYSEMTQEEVAQDTAEAFSISSEYELPFGPFLAYPYGKYPRKDPAQMQFFDYLKQQQFVYGLRIGNRLNDFPFKNPYEIQRIDVKGEWSLKKFKRKIKFGNLV